MAVLSAEATACLAPTTGRASYGVANLVERMIVRARAELGRAPAARLSYPSPLTPTLSPFPGERDFYGKTPNSR